MVEAVTNSSTTISSALFSVASASVAVGGCGVVDVAVAVAGAVAGVVVVAGAGAGVEPISMVMIPKRGNDAEGVRVLDLSKGTETNKALSDLGLIITDLVKSYMGAAPEEYVDEEEFIEPEFTTYDNEKTKE